MTGHGDRGSATPFLALTVVAIVAVTASLYEASARVRAYLRARDIAQAAAAAGAQRLDLDALHKGVLEVDAAAAASEVAAYLAAVGSEGRVLEVGSTTAPSSCGMDTTARPPRQRSCVRVSVTERFGATRAWSVTATGSAHPVAGGGRSP